MKKVFWSISLVALVVISCSSERGKMADEKGETPLKIKEVITRHYTFKMIGGEPKKDSIKECFSCNQGIEYNKQGRELVLRFYKADLDSIYGYEIYKYNDWGQKIGSDYYENDSVVTSNVYELDSVGNIKISKAIDKKTGKMLYGYRHRYDERGNLFETGNLNAEGEVYEYYRYAHNEFGVVTTEEIVDLEGNPTFEIKYEYYPEPDSTWVDQITYHNGKLSEIRHRDFLYFN
ncbi:hypothetical protein QQ020_11400 [Fulvivirgaceae bacterium BMA12]|uniref:Uncharacterized protein n=1 Tax=Agaribacillus aureus TaxID=3051825 RepID=A0ABT8L8U7_9BACT|nr:hypothetical protein [Fulvivirgaceae bacterium BMA12]